MATNKRKGSSMKIEGYILLSERIEQEGDKFIAFCDELGLATFSTTHAGAQKRLRSAVKATLNKATELGDEEALFESRQIRFYASNPMTTIPKNCRFISCDSGFTHQGTLHLPYELQPVAH